MNKDQRYSERLKSARLLRCEYKLIPEDKKLFDDMYKNSDSYKLRAETMRKYTKREKS
jgi:uncharacterized protein (DUF2236 family)